MNLKNTIRLLKTSPFLIPVLALIDAVIWAVDWLAICTTPVTPRPSSLLIVRLDVFGDYLMFRSYLSRIRNSGAYRNHSVTLLGNAAIRSVAEAFDKDLIDRFIWVDIYKLSTRPLYRYRVIRQLRQSGFSTVFCPTFSRVLVLDDFIAWASGASERVGCLTDFVNIKPWEAQVGNRLYTRLLDSGSGIVFEAERNRRIVEAFLKEEVEPASPNLDPAKATPVEVPDRYVVLSLGAGQDFRVWPAPRFAAVAAFIQRQYPDYWILLTGASNERKYADAFLKEVPDISHLIDLTGQLSIPQLIYVLSNADLLIANETGTVHVAAATQTPTLVVSQGKTLLRWHPYPPELSTCIHHLYPDYLEQNRHRFDEIAPAFNPESRFSIEEVSVERVMDAVQKLISVRHSG